MLQNCFCFMFWFFGHEACGILAPWPGMEPCIGRWSLNHWTTGQVLGHTFLYMLHTLCTPWFCVLLTRVQLFATPGSVARQAPLSMEFPRQEYWSWLPFPSPGDLPDPGMEPRSPALAGGFFTTEPSGKSYKIGMGVQILGCMMFYLTKDTENLINILKITEKGWK